MKRIKLKKKRKITVSNYLSLLFILIIISVIIGLIYVGKKVNPKIQDYAEVRAKKIISLVLSQSIPDEVIDILESDQLFITNKNEDGTISSVDFNSIIVNKVLSKVSSNVKNYLKKLESGEIEEIGLTDTTMFTTNQNNLENGIIYEVPTGIIFNNGLLSNIGPKIPVKLSYLGNVVTDIETSISDYGINNAIVEIGIKVSVTEQVVLPFYSSEIEVETVIPVTIKLIQGTVPNYYFNGQENPSLSLSTNN
jgi:sporulation protein YunB